MIHLPEGITTIPELFQKAGYATAHFGKWHMGATDDKRPAAKGFDRSTALMQGGASHLNLDRMLSVFPRTLIFDDDVEVGLVLHAG